MNCAECRGLVQREADGEEVLGRAALEQHLRACAACRAFRHGLARVVEAVRQAPPAPSADFQARLLDAVLADQARPVPTPERGGSFLPWAAPLALAASVLVGLAIYLWRDQTPTPDFVEQPQPAPGNLRDSVREAGTALSALTSKTADEVVDQTLRLLPNVSTPALPNLDPMEPPGRSLAQAGQAVADGFQPVTDSARRAFDLFLRELPLSPQTNPGL